LETIELGIEVVDENCTGCYRCERVCPTEAIVMIGPKTEALAVVDNDKCIAGNRYRRGRDQKLVSGRRHFADPPGLSLQQPDGSGHRGNHPAGCTYLRGALATYRGAVRVSVVLLHPPATPVARRNRRCADDLEVAPIRQRPVVDEHRPRAGGQVPAVRNPDRTGMASERNGRSRSGSVNRSFS